MPEQFENGRKLDGKDSFQGFDAKEVCLHPKNLSVSFQKRLIMFCFRHFQVFTRCSFPNVPIRVPFSKSTVFKICRQKMCRFRVNRRPIRRIFHRFQNVPASCERSLRNLHMNIKCPETIQIEVRIASSEPRNISYSIFGVKIYHKHSFSFIWTQKYHFWQGPRYKGGPGGHGPIKIFQQLLQ